MTPEDHDIIDKKHAQKHFNSCPTSMVEMLLKLKRAVPDTYSELQDDDPTGKEGVGHLVNAKLAGNWTARRIPAGDWEFPLVDIKAKLAAGEPVGIVENPENAYAHGWIVTAVKTNAAGEEEVHLKSKYSEDGSGSGKKSVPMVVKAAELSKHRWSDPLYLEQISKAAGAP
jgi:hypothetical protein